MTDQKKNYSYLDKIALESDKWEELDKNELQVMTFRTCFLYGETRNKNIIPVLFRMYEYLISNSSSEERTKLLAALSSVVRKNNPKAIMALFPFIQVETDGEIVRAASQFFVNLSVLSNKEFHSGSNILLELIKDAPEDRNSAYIILGLMDIENEKINQMLRTVKPQLGLEVISILHNNGVQL
ncbi:hypothetical protein [Marinifilum caeruleilacunae]|jgi:hypothetical protein|uniref:HEAT repeat domain-containing protein n=1 Tax=Marinifilum caeruleilacunae TaxID=2499076 RepID=A0ABX1X0W8_9BACT|nr:hypothetical protein [Marinifilum caeruleilacunae]NOU61748.1 hypothetical protein [Marinifilum caeruleilacunae]